jgi:hypothetical protein
MTWQVDQVGTARAIINIRKRMRRRIDVNIAVSEVGQKTGNRERFLVVFWAFMS